MDSKLPDKDSKTKMKLVKKLEMSGVVCASDLSYLRAQDLMPVLSLVESRKLVREWEHLKDTKGLFL